jgi:hypothetical protein
MQNILFCASFFIFFAIQLRSCPIDSPLIAIGTDADWPLPHHYDERRGILEQGESYDLHVAS